MTSQRYGRGRVLFLHNMITAHRSPISDHRIPSLLIFFSFLEQKKAHVGHFLSFAFHKTLPRTPVHLLIQETKKRASKTDHSIPQGPPPHTPSPLPSSPQSHARTRAEPNSAGFPIKASTTTT